MTRINSRQKGAAYERKVGAALRSWWGTGPGTFRRQDTGLRQPGGDLRTPHDFPFHVECKNREGWTIEDLFKRGKEGPWQWFHDAQAEAGDTPVLLIFTRNRQPSYALVCDEGLEILGHPTQTAIIPLGDPPEAPCLSLFTLAQLVATEPPRRHGLRVVS